MGRVALHGTTLTALGSVHGSTPSEETCDGLWQSTLPVCRLQETSTKDDARGSPSACRTGFFGHLWRKTWPRRPRKTLPTVELCSASRPSGRAEHGLSACTRASRRPLFALPHARFLALHGTRGFQTPYRCIEVVPCSQVESVEEKDARNCLLGTASQVGFHAHRIYRSPIGIAGSCPRMDRGCTELPLGYKFRAPLVPTGDRAPSVRGIIGQDFGAGVRVSE